MTAETTQALTPLFSAVTTKTTRGQCASFALGSRNFWQGAPGVRADCPAAKALLNGAILAQRAASVLPCRYPRRALLAFYTGPFSVTLQPDSKMG